MFKDKESPSSLNNQDYNCLYFDLSSVIYKAVKNLWLCDPNFIESTKKYIKKVVSLVKPDVLIYIAVDGVMSAIEMQCEANKNFVSGKEDLHKKVLYKTYDQPGKHINGADKYTIKFDSNLTAPGTELSEVIHEVLRSFIDIEVNTNEIWKKCQVLYSSYNTQGNGAQKVIEYIKKNSKYLKKYKHLLCSLNYDYAETLALTVPYDVDILMYDPFINPDDISQNLLLEDNIMDKMGILEINEFKKGIIFAFMDEGVPNEVDKVSLVKDYVLLKLVFDGNMLPAPPGSSFCPIDGVYGIGLLNEVYAKSYNSCKSCICKGSKVQSIMVNALKSFFKVCADSQHEILGKISNMINADTTIDKKTAAKLCLHSNEQKRKYYKTCLNAHNEIDITNVCERFFRSLYWIVKQYVYNGCDDGEALLQFEDYPYDYAPLMSDLANFKLDENTFSLPNAISTITSYEQQLLTIPSLSAGMLPEALEELFFDRKNICLAGSSEVIRCKDIVKQYNIEEKRSCGFLTIFTLKILFLVNSMLLGSIMKVKMFYFCLSVIM